MCQTVECRVHFSSTHFEKHWKILWLCYTVLPIQRTGACRSQRIELPQDVVCQYSRQADHSNLQCLQTNAYTLDGLLDDRQRGTLGKGLKENHLPYLADHIWEAGPNTRFLLQESVDTARSSHRLDFGATCTGLTIGRPCCAFPLGMCDPAR